MLDELSKGILNFMNTGSENPSQRVYNFDESLDEIAKATGSDAEAVRTAVRYLEANGYIKYQKTTTGHTIGFYLDHKGLHYEEFRTLERKDFLKKSILIPILVTLATNGIIALLKWLLPLIQELLAHTPG